MNANMMCVIAGHQPGVGVVQARHVRAAARRGDLQLPGEDGRPCRDGGRDRGRGAQPRHVRLQQWRHERDPVEDTEGRRRSQSAPVLEPRQVGVEPRRTGKHTFFNEMTSSSNFMTQGGSYTIALLGVSLTLVNTMSYQYTACYFHVLFSCFYLISITVQWHVCMATTWAE